MTVEATPPCPDCGSPMVLRTARRGKNKGGQFWGCSRYPKCRGTRDGSEHPPSTDGERTHEAVPARQEANDSDLELPVAFVAEPDAPGRQCAFFQSVALPAPIVEAVEKQDVDAATIARFSQWRLDYPLPSKKAPDPDLDHTLALAEDLLLRGSTPLCFPELESLVRLDGDSMAQGESLTAVFEGITARPTSAHVPSRFDSDEERQLLEHLADLVVTETLSWTFQTQVELASLSLEAPEEALQRCDILAVDSSGSRLVVEVDGEQHEQHVAVDAARDALLAAADVEVICVPAREVRQGAGGSLDSLRSRMLTGSRWSRPGESSARTIRWHRVLHQLQVALVKAIRSGDLALTESASVLIELPDILNDDHQANEYLEAAVQTLGEFLQRGR